MKFESFIGVDVSKLTLDLCLVSQDGVIENFKIDNKPSVLSVVLPKYLNQLL